MDRNFVEVSQTIDLNIKRMNYERNILKKKLPRQKTVGIHPSKGIDKEILLKVVMLN